MSILPDLYQSQAQMITFVLVDSNNVEVAGLGAVFSLEVSKAGAAFVAGAGTLGEIGNGWYRYQTTAAETDTPGPLSVRAFGAGTVQQNLVYNVREPMVSAREFTYTVTRSDNSQPIEGVEVWFTTDAAGNNIIWTGLTDAFGVVRDNAGELPRLNDGTYYVWRRKQGYAFDNPDTEVVSAD